MTCDAKTNKLFRCIVHIVRNDNRCNRQIRFETDQIHMFSSCFNHLFLSVCNYTYEQSGIIQSRKMCINTPIDTVHRYCCCCCCGRCFCVVFFCLSIQIRFRYTLFRRCNRALESNSKTPRSYYVFQPIPPQIAERKKNVLFCSHFTSPSPCVFFLFIFGHCCCYCCHFCCRHYC